MTADPREQPAAAEVCEHYWAHHVYGGLSARLCQFCHEPDWDELLDQFVDGARKAALAERERMLDVLADHYLAGIECDRERRLDNPVCGCSLVFLGWHPSIGAARQAWTDHVGSMLEGP